MKIDLTEEEAQALMQLLDIATKAGGLQAASAALPLAAKLQQAAQSAALAGNDDTEETEEAE